MSKIVVALGGNALQKDGDATAQAQENVARLTVKKLIPLIKAGHQIVIVHGNGPQVGNIVLHEEAIDTEKTPTLPLDSCVAMTQGMIGFWLQKAFMEEFKKENIDKSAVSIVTQIEVSATDEAFKDPTKPIGPFYSEAEAMDVRDRKGYNVKEDSGRGWRRVVPSPMPIDIVEKDIVENLLDDDIVVIAGGGGGVPIVKNDNGTYSGISGIIDKDFASELLAEEIKADTFMILTAVDNAMINFGQPNEAALGQISASEAESLIAQGHFGAGSMLPKMEAAVQFAKFGGKAVITSLENAQTAISENLGTIIE